MNNQTKKGMMFEADCVRFMKLRNIHSKEQLRQMTTCGSNKTFAKYFQNPNLMPLGVFGQIMDALKVPETDRMQIYKNLMGERT